MSKVLFSELSYEEKLRRTKKVADFVLPNNQVFIHCGTLLGAIREGGLIEHDDDFDVAYLSNYHTKEEVKNEMLDIYKYLKEKGMLVKYFDLNYREVFEFENMVYGLGQAHIMIDDFVIDLWTTWIDEDGDFNLFDMKKITKSILPLVKTTIYGIEFNCPVNGEEIIEKIYGRDWKIPQKKKPPKVGTCGKFIQLR